MEQRKSWKEPLLGKARSTQRQGQGAAAAVNMVFVERLWGVMRIAQCGDCLVLILLSVVEVAILSQAGLVVGHFYSALINKNAKLFLATVGQYMLWYGGEAICKAAQGWAAEWLAIGWRQKLTQAAHNAYCTSPSLCRLSQHGAIDNPDERVTNEIDCLCQTLAQLMLKTIAAPLMILYYTWWVGYHVGWFGPLVVYGFFAIGAALIRWVISPIARLVARQEKLEAFFRISHVRLHVSAEAIAMSDSADYEKARLEEDLEAALSNRKTLLLRHFLLAVTTNAYDYLGGVSFACVLAIPVFGGLFDSDDSGQLANLISNASFAALQLIYSFSQVMDTAKLVSDLAGYTSRVGELFEVLEIMPQSKDSSGLSCKQKDICPMLEVDTFNPLASERDLGVRHESYVISPPTCLSLDKGRTIELSIHFAPPALHERLGKSYPGRPPASWLIVPVFMTSVASKTGRNIQGIDWTMVVEPVCDDRLPGGNGISSPDTDELSGNRETLEELMLCIVNILRDLGHWTDALDLSTGHALSCMDQGESEDQEPDLGRVINVARTSNLCVPSKSAEKHSSYNQVEAAKALLGYSSIDVGSMSVINHPRFGHNYFASSIFTTAPARVLQSVLDSCVKGVAAFCEEDTESSGNDLLQTVPNPKPDVLTTCKLQPALVVDNVTCFILGSQIPVVQNLTLQLLWGESLLVMGATGCGKTSFLRALSGLLPLQNGKIRMPPMLSGKGVLMLSQQPLMATAGLAGQISYPELSPSKQKLSSLKILRLRNALEAVGMLHIMKQFNDDWEMENGWVDTLSPGQQQSLALSRVMYHQPQLAILDEATSALSEDAEDAIYEHMVRMGISVISVAHRSRLIRHHTKQLVMLGDGRGGWWLS